MDKHGRSVLYHLCCTILYGHQSSLFNGHCWDSWQCASVPHSLDFVNFECAEVSTLLPLAHCDSLARFFATPTVSETRSISISVFHIAHEEFIVGYQICQIHLKISMEFCPCSNCTFNKTNSFGQTVDKHGRSVLYHFALHHFIRAPKFSFQRTFFAGTVGNVRKCRTASTL